MSSNTHDKTLTDPMNAMAALQMADYGDARHHQMSTAGSGTIEFGNPFWNFEPPKVVNPAHENQLSGWNSVQPLANDRVLPDIGGGQTHRSRFCQPSRPSQTRKSPVRQKQKQQQQKQQPKRSPERYTRPRNRNVPREENARDTACRNIIKSMAGMSLVEASAAGILQKEHLASLASAEAFWESQASKAPRLKPKATYKPATNKAAWRPKKGHEIFDI